MYLNIMAALETSRSWSGKGNPVWGLTTKSGPWKSTPKDLKEFNSRSGGPHAGNGNWMQQFNPHPYIQTMPTSGLPYYTTSDVVTKEDYAPPAGLKIPGITRINMKGMAGGRSQKDIMKSKYGVNGSYPNHGAFGNGMENVKEKEKQGEDHEAFPERIIHIKIGYDTKNSESLVGKSEGTNSSDTLASIINQINGTINIKKDKGKGKEIPKPEEPKTGIFSNIPKYTHHKPGGSGLSKEDREKTKTMIAPPPPPPPPKIDRMDVDPIKLKTRKKLGSKRKNSLSIVSIAKREKEGNEGLKRRNEGDHGGARKRIRDHFH